MPPRTADGGQVRARTGSGRAAVVCRRYAALHTLATARLRQGRLAEVEPLCAEVLASAPDPGTRATTLATVVLARRALGEPYEELLAEAVALSPDADLVAEAAGREAAPRAAG
jgi:hypothetical protein